MAAIKWSKLGTNDGSVSYMTGVNTKAIAYNMLTIHVKCIYSIQMKMRNNLLINNGT